MERIRRVEDDLKFQRELIVTRFEAVDKRFEDLTRSMDKRFEAVDKRFDDVNKRFEDMHKRFTGMQWMVGGGVVILATMMSLFQFLG